MLCDQETHINSGSVGHKLHASNIHFNLPFRFQVHVPRPWNSASVEDSARNFANVPSRGA